MKPMLLPIPTAALILALAPPASADADIDGQIAYILDAMPQPGGD